jgi:aspartyl-tRNA synthetase
MSAAETVEMEEEETVLAAKIASLGDQIRQAKEAGQPAEEWQPLLQEMLAAKATYKEQFGKEFGAKPDSKKSKEQPHVPDAPSDKNKEKREAKAKAKAEKEEKKRLARLEREQREKAKADRLAGANNPYFGDAAMVQSQDLTENKAWTSFEHLTPALSGQTVWVRGHLQTTRLAGRIVFTLLRNTLYSVQAVAAEGSEPHVDNAMIQYISTIPTESVVDIQGKVTIPNVPIASATQKQVEIQITQCHVISKAKALPFSIEDASRPEPHETDVGEYHEVDEELEQADGTARVGQKIRLDNRWLDLRTPANQAIFRIESMVGALFRECLLKKGFIEIHSPKLIGGASEGGSDVFKLDYFGQPACLAMSPQLHKQMTAACSGFEKVFEVGPVFRAENSNTRRHLCEFTGLDLEMTIHEHYYEVLDVFSDLFLYIFDGINERCKPELERVREQHPFQDLQYLRPTLKLTYAEGCALLREAGVPQEDTDDLSTENEKKLGDIVKAKYKTDFFFMDKYPLSVRPFYTMPCPENPQLSNSYDFFIRGQEILSGAQRIHDPDLLEARATAHGIGLHDIKAYVDSFRNGAMPHAGGGIGLERVVMLFLGLPNIRKAAWFPRDPKRISP